MTHAITGFISLYGELAFAIVCTFWIVAEVKALFKKGGPHG